MHIKISVFSFLILFGILLLLPAQEVTFSVISSNEKSIYLRIDFPEMELRKIDEKGAIMHKIIMKEAFPVEKSGAPEILKSTKSIIIPNGTTPTLKVLDIHSEIIENFELAPSKGVLYRNQNPKSIPYTKGKEYQVDAFYPSNVVELNERYVLRDFDAISISCYPFSYNPVAKTLKKIHYLVIRIDFEGNYKKKEKRLSQEFVPIYSRHFLNFTSTHYTLKQEAGDMLMITPEVYTSALGPLKSWKIKNGIRTEIVTRESIGTTPVAIKDYITNYYQDSTRNLVFVLLVGDRTTMPPYLLSGGIQDNWYTEVDGDDTYPDLFLGRFLASNLEEVRVQVEKSIAYESNPLERTHFPIFCGIASNEGPGDQDEWDYVHIQNISKKLRNFTYTSGTELLHLPIVGAPPPTAGMLSNALNNGVGIVNYAGHGNWDRFTTTSFYNSYIDALTNYNKLPFIISVACQNGNYNRPQPCFAQKWLTATRNGQPTGAVATVMSTIDQSWNPPMAGQDEMINILTETHSEGIRRTFGAICFNGFLKMMEAYPSDYPHYSHEVYRTWLIFGDPSLTVRTAMPSEITALYPKRISSEINSITVQSAVEGAKVVLTCRNAILGQGYIENGTVTVSYTDSISIGDTIHVLASKFNHIPYQGKIAVGDSCSPAMSHHKDIQIYIYPNPVKHHVTVNFNQHILEHGSIYLYDVYGRLIMYHPVQNRIENISVEAFPHGVYILQVMDKNRIIKNFKMIKN